MVRDVLNVVRKVLPSQTSTSAAELAAMNSDQGVLGAGGARVPDAQEHRALADQHGAGGGLAITTGGSISRYAVVLTCLSVNWVLHAILSCDPSVGVGSLQGIA